MNTYGHAEFDVDYVTQSDQTNTSMLFVLTQMNVLVWSTVPTLVRHIPDYFGKMREQWMNTLQPEKYDIKTRTAGNGAWALETVTFPDLKGVVETKKHKTETAMQVELLAQCQWQYL